MKSAKQLLGFLAVGHVEVKKGGLYYKDYNVAYPDQYHIRCTQFFAEFQSYLFEKAESIDFFTLLKDASSMQHTHTYFYQEEAKFDNVLSVKKPKGLNQVKADAIVEKYRVPLYELVLHEEELFEDAIRAIIKARPKPKNKVVKVEPTIAPINKVEFTGEAITLIALFELLRKSKKLVFTDQKHFEAFVVGNFTSNDGKPIQNVDKSLSVLRNSSDAKAYRKRKDKAEALVSTIINPLIAIKEEIEATPLHHKNE
jgi:hypothetical protein